jgi:uncharacterized protein YhaN
VIPTELDSIIRVATKAVAQDDNTPESERMCCRHLLKLAIPLLEQARLEAELHAIRSAADRDAAARIRDAVIGQAMQGRRSREDWSAVCSAVMDAWGPASLGSYPTGVARTGD